MARTLSATITNLIADGGAAANVQRTCHLLRFTIAPNNYFFTDGQGSGDGILHNTNLYLPHLRVPQGPRYHEKLRNDPLRVELQNIDLNTAMTLKAEAPDIQGTVATLERLYLAARETVTLFVGPIGQIDVDERKVTLELLGDLDPTASAIPTRKYSQLCSHNFKGEGCDYVDGVDPDDPVTELPYTSCGKTFEDCVARGRQQRFDGFIFITRDLTLAVEGQVPDAAPPNDTVGNYLD